MGAPPPIQLATLGMWDSFILMVLALVVFGPRRLPQIGRQIGKLMYEFRKASNDFKFQMEEELRISEDADRRKKEEAERARNLALNPPAPTVEAQADIGAVEQASVSASPTSAYPADPVAEPAAAAAEEEHTIRYPRINPPSTGEPVRAEKPGSMAPAEGASEAAAAEISVGETSVAAEANIGAEPAPAQPAGEPTRTETVSQHG